MRSNIHNRLRCDRIAHPTATHIVAETVVNLTRKQSSTNGNPRYKIECAHGTSYVTEADAMMAFSITNSDVLGNLPAGVELGLNNQGRVVSVKRLSPEVVL